LRRFFKKKISRSIGLDLGSATVKAVELTRDGDGVTLSGLSCSERRPGEDLGETLGRVLGQRSLSGREVTLAVGGRGVLVRYVPMPKASEAELRQAMPLEAERLLPLELDEMQLDFQVLGPRSNGRGGEAEEVSVLLAACRRDEVQERLDLTRRRGLVPGAMDVELFAVLNAWERATAEPLSHGAGEGAEEDDSAGDAPGAAKCEAARDATEEASEDATREAPDETHGREGEEPSVAAHSQDGPVPSPAGGLENESGVAVVDVGATRTTVSVLCGGRPCFSREIGLGGADLTQAVARALGLGTEDAEAQKRAPGEREDELRAATGGVLEDLGHELAHSLDYVEHHEGLPVKEVWVSGGGALAPGVIDWLGAALARPVAAWDPLAGLAPRADARGLEELDAWRSSLAVALGLAWRGLAK
jgi:Tfp pilus assembly PilM family ATPase